MCHRESRRRKGKIEKVKMAAIVNQAFRRYLQTTVQRGVQVQGPSAVSGQHEGGFKIWKNLTIFVAFPSILLCGVNCYLAHQSGHHGQPEFVKYDYLRVRTKRFPWGEGNRSLFHNSHVNALPDGYEAH
ncbi:cytochrome c oxidase subunit 6A2, mitochondrial [Anoplophora glabripennis]|uniref:cytochrome c oxidase subunit 6A2, mitochondrial n=1 Tax=Anoplophora glabripennis TaxID=217634 RepID=UPI0008758728|nr:cytochrome c oxidase subunit 6A2, mitochondrial [Anoplophora glabripennis]